MADDIATDLDTTEAFCDIAKATGKKLKDALEKGISPITETPKFLSFNIDSFKIDGSENILKDVMKRFEDHEFKRLHNDGQLEWRVIRLVIESKSFEKNTYGGKAGDPYVLTLFVGGEDEGKIGRSFSLNENFTVEEGDIYLGYEVKKA